MIQELLLEKKKKRKKRKEYLLLTDFECLSEDEVMETIHDIRVRLRSIFKTHIGNENAISPVDLFERIYGIHPMHLDIYKKQYWWNVIKLCLRQLRNEETLFVINKRTKLFVLQTYEEASDFKKIIDRDIENMKKVKIKADEWVRKRKWESI